MALSALVLLVVVARVATDRGHTSKAADRDPWRTFRLGKSHRRPEQPLGARHSPTWPLQDDALPATVANASESGDGGRAKRQTLEPVAHDPSSDPLAHHPNSELVAQNSSSSRDYSDEADVDAQVEEDSEDDEDDVDVDVDEEGDDDRHEGGGGHGHGQKKKKGHKKKKKKKKHHGLLSVMKKMKKHLPGILHKMHGPSMFMMGMAQANFHNFVMHALMMSKMALTTVVFMIIREMVFGDKDQPVKYYNFGYDHHRRTLYQSPYDHPYDYKRRRKRRTAAA